MSKVSQSSAFVPLKQTPFFRDWEVEAHDVTVGFPKVIPYICNGTKMRTFSLFTHTAIHVY